MENIYLKSIYSDIAKIAFETMQKIRMLNKENDIEEYDCLNNERKMQLINNVIHVIENKEITAEEEHKQWMKLKLNDNWEYGIETDRKNKIHNCLVPFELLNYYQILKDIIFIDVVKSFCKYNRCEELGGFTINELYECYSVEEIALYDYRISGDD